MQWPGIGRIRINSRYRMKRVACLLSLLLLGAGPLLADHLQWSPKEFIDRINGGLCRSYSENNFSRFRTILKNSSLRALHREMPLEEAYQYLRCNQFSAENIDLLRMTPEIPIKAREAAQELVDYFVEEADDKTLLGKIVSCRLDFGYGCLNVFEHVEKNLRESRENTAQVKALNDFKALLLNNLDERDLIYDTAFCRRYVGQPAHCDC